MQISNNKLADVGGLDEKLLELIKLLQKVMVRSAYTLLGRTPPQGILLHGPPGCGKTLLAHAIAGVSRYLLSGVPVVLL